MVSPLLRRLPDDDRRDGDVWAVSCFVVRPQFRSRGVSRALLDGAVGYARSAGARIVEGYPVDVAAAPRISTSGLYHGAWSTFVAAGFTEVARPRQDRPIMRLTLR
jgi:GNAT superfamily N-acetyltransferase